MKNDLKIFIISDEIPDNHPEFKNQKWICDILKQEFEIYFHDNISEAENADIIWYLAPWNHRFVPKGFTTKEWTEFLKSKYVIATIHHIDKKKYSAGEHKPIMNFTKTYVDLYHSICNLTTQTLKELNHGIKIIQVPLWINENVFFNLENNNFREKYGFSKNAFLVGSFQKDTEGKKYWKCPHCFKCNRDKLKNTICNYCRKDAPQWTNKPNKLDKFEFYPKLSKGPDIFFKIINDMKKHNDNIEVVLSGLRRDYLITKLKKANIKYHYFEMIDLSELNEIYNCLDLYLISARCEGGPRAVFEAGLTKTPIISTDVGVAKQLLNEESIFDVDKWETYKTAKPDVNKVYENVSKLTIHNYLDTFFDKLVDDYESIKFKTYKLGLVGNLNIVLSCNTDTEIIIKDCKIMLYKGNNVIMYNNNDGDNIEFSERKHIDNISIDTLGQNRLNNRKFNILLCSDKDYFVGLFACLNSVIVNSRKDVSKIHFNFMVPLEDSTHFYSTFNQFITLKNIQLSYTVILIDINVLPHDIVNSKCYKGGNHLLNLGNFSRLLIGEIYSCKKLIYLDSDSIVQYNIYQKLKRFKLTLPLYSLLMNKDKLTLKMKSLVNQSGKWKKLIGQEIDIEKYAFMGAPFMTDCGMWDNVFKKVSAIIREHNSTENGLYKLFTMSLQNIIFYDKIGDISQVLKCLPDCGSKRKNWSNDTLKKHDVLDWSGCLKPWFNNGLYKQYWDKYDILNLSSNFGNAENNKITIENFKKNQKNIKKTYIPPIISTKKIEKPSIRNLIVCTTATNRPDLHSTNIQDWALFIGTMRTQFNILWILNVDEIELLKFSYKETVSNFKNLLPPNIELLILKKKEPGFLKTCQRMVKKIKAVIKDRQYIEDDTYIFWLEDDWKLNKACTCNIDLVKLANILTDKAYMNFSFIRNNYFWALAPSLMKYSYFKNIHSSGWLQIEKSNIVGDPEHLLGRFFIKNIARKPEKLKSINIINNQWKKIKSGYLNSDFFQKDNKRVIIYEKQFMPTFPFENNIEIEEIPNFVNNDYVFIRITPGWCDGGVEFGRKYMRSKNIKKWSKGDVGCKYNNKK